MTATRTITLKQAEERLALLLAEDRALASRTDAARRDGDAALWMELQTRAETLPGEIAHATLMVRPLRLAHRWVVAEACHVAELVAISDRDSAHAEWREAASARWETPNPAATTMYEIGQERARIAAEREATLTAMSQRAYDAQTALDGARQTTAEALFEVDRIEAELLAADAGFEREDGPGIRMLPRIATANFIIASLSYGPLVDLDPVPGGCLLRGMQPPRWLHHLLGDHPFKPRGGDPRDDPRDDDGETLIAFGDMVTTVVTG